VFGAPASATFTGAGNLVAGTVGTAGKGKAKAKGRPGCRARARRIKQPGRRRRALQRCAKSRVRTRGSARGARGSARGVGGAGVGRGVSVRAGR
jgi:hypothetical protein